MSKIILFCKKHWFEIAILLIILFSAFLRFYNYENRWGLSYDQAHDALVGRYTYEAHKIPLLGPFSSAGPFQTSGTWYIFIAFANLINPNSVMTPWVFITILYVVFVFLAILIGKNLVDRTFGLILGLLAMVSTAQISQATNLTVTAPLSVISLLAIWAMINYVRKKENKFLFILGFLIGLAPTIHLQGVSLSLFLLLTIIFTGIPKPKKIIFLILGIVIPLIPLIIFDIKNNFVNSGNMLKYYLYDQYKVSLDVLGRRWLTYLGIFWPKAWSNIIGGQVILGYVIIVCLTVTVAINFFKKSFSKELRIILLFLLLAIVVIRYARTPLFDSYLVLLHPFILVLTAFLVYLLYKKNIFIGIALLVIILAGSMKKDLFEIKIASNYSAREAKTQMKDLSKKFPNQKFAIYAYEYKWADKNLMLSLFMDVNKKIDDDGRRVGIIFATREAEFKYPIAVGDKVGYQIVDLENFKKEELIKSGWVLVNPSAVYESTEDWIDKQKNK